MKLAWYVYNVEALDFFEESTVPVSEWLKRPGASGRNLQEKRDELFDALFTVSQHPCWDWHMRLEPHVAYYPRQDTWYFIFKLNNNGSTFLVSGFEMPEFPDVVVY